MPKNLTFLRRFLFLAGILLSLLVLAGIILAVMTPVTMSGASYLLGSLLVAVGLILARWRIRYHVGLILCGFLIILGVAGGRLRMIQSEDSRLKLLILPTARETRFVNALIDERDTLLFGEELLRWIGGVSAREHADLLPAVSSAYREAGTVNGVFPSPVMSTYLGLQKLAAFDTVVIEPPAAQSTPPGVIFLHGFAGNVTVQCWEIAQAVEAIGAVTVCPSTDWMGDWWQPEGEAILKETFAYLRKRGIRRIYLGGFSNGGNGVGRLIPTVRSQPELRGLFFIAGARNATGVRETGLPVLVIQGTNDERFPVEAARQFVTELGEGVAYTEIEADHFLILKQPQLVQEAISSWFQTQESIH